MPISPSPRQGLAHALLTSHWECAGIQPQASAGNDVKPREKSWGANGEGAVRVRLPAPLTAATNTRQGLVKRGLAGLAGESLAEVTARQRGGAHGHAGDGKRKAAGFCASVVRSIPSSPPPVFQPGTPGRAAGRCGQAGGSWGHRGPRGQLLRAWGNHQLPGCYSRFV